MSQGLHKTLGHVALVRIETFVSMYSLLTISCVTALLSFCIQSLDSQSLRTTKLKFTREHFILCQRVISYDLAQLGR